jgi:dihydrofolate synthase/folylpolyglutamate synthase
MRLGLEPMRSACARAGHPERAFPAVHVAGTNGKGSVCAMVEAIARADGRKTGLYTSPHLCRFAERIRLGGEPVDDGLLSSLLDRALEAGPDLSFFETATLAGFFAFQDARIDLAVLEVGMGGRLDATNVIPPPRAAAITRIALDHTDRLGSTLVDIAREKAGIAKAGVDIVVGDVPRSVREAIDEVAHAHGATTSQTTQETPAGVGLPGEHQRENARIAATLGVRIGASPIAIARGIATARWPGRLERIGEFLLDAAHNPDGADALARHLRSLALAPDCIALVFGTLADKDWTPMLDVLAPLAGTRIYVAPARASRSVVDPQVMAKRHFGRIASSVEEALAIVGGSPGPVPPPGLGGPSPAPPGPGRPLVVVAGSLVLVGQARARLLALPCDPPVAL